MALKLRDVVLGLLVLQTTSIVLLMHYTRTVSRAEDGSPRYLASGAVFLAELLKLPFCLCAAAYTMRGLRGLQLLLASEVLGQPLETLKCSLPALAYTVQVSARQEHSCSAVCS